MKLFRSAMFLSFLCVTCSPVWVWTQMQGTPAIPTASPQTSLGKTNQGIPAAQNSEGNTINLAQTRPQSLHLVGDATAGSRTFSTNCSGCHGSDGRGGERAHNIATAREVMALSDNDLVSILHNGITGSGMPAFAYLGNKGIDDVVAYLRTLQGKVAVVKVNGDARAGRDLFYGKADCGRCHIVKGEGGFMAPDLTDFGAGMAAETIELAITKPDARLQPNQAVVSVLLTDGTTVQGTARSEDNFTITLQEQDGRFRTFNKQRVASILHMGHSIMPKDYETRLSRKAVDDLVRYLVAVSADAPAKPARGRR
jgi:putative heme-binding domain-containing protein